MERGTHFFGGGIDFGSPAETSIFVDPELVLQTVSRQDSNSSGTPESTSSRTARSSIDSHISKASTASSPPSVAPPSKRRRTRKPRVSAATSQDAEKRGKFLERNRVAASKCRQKKKEYVSGLEETKADLESLNTHLTLERTKLLNELTSIKSHLMLHAGCNDRNINHWMMNEARQFVASNSNAAGVVDPLLAPPDAPAIKGEEESPRETLMDYPELPFLHLDLEPEKEPDPVLQCQFAPESPQNESQLTASQ
jgi:hypothetical protein